MLLLYVSATVPLRAGFEVNLDLWSFGFFFDLAVDLFFIADLCVRGKTANDYACCRRRRPILIPPDTVDLAVC